MAEFRCPNPRCDAVGRGRYNSRCPDCVRRRKQTEQQRNRRYGSHLPPIVLMPSDVKALRDLYQVTAISFRNARDERNSFRQIQLPHSLGNALMKQEQSLAALLGALEGLGAQRLPRAETHHGGTERVPRSRRHPTRTKRDP